MCTNGMNVDQLGQMIDTIDDCTALDFLAMSRCARFLNAGFRPSMQVFCGCGSSLWHFPRSRILAMFKVDFSDMQ